MIKIKKYLNSIKLKILKLLGKQDKKITVILGGRSPDRTEPISREALKMAYKDLKGGKKHLRKYYNID